MLLTQTQHSVSIFQTNTHILKDRPDVRGNEQQRHFIGSHFFELQHDLEEFPDENNWREIREVTTTIYGYYTAVSSKRRTHASHAKTPDHIIALKISFSLQNQQIFYVFIQSPRFAPALFDISKMNGMEGMTFLHPHPDDYVLRCCQITKHILAHYFYDFEQENFGL